MKSRDNITGYVDRTQDELLLSGNAAAELLKAAMDKGKPFKFKAGGWSMAPFIRDGDILTLSPSLISFPQKGDVVGVVDQFTKKLMVHRIVGIKNGRYQIKGDGADKEDPGTFDLNGIYGHVTKIERDGKPVRFGLGPERSVIAILSRVPILMWLASKAIGLRRRVGRAEVRIQNTGVRR